MTLALEVEADGRGPIAAGGSIHRKLDGEMGQVVARAQRSVVRVVDGRGSGGAGVILHPQGLILTSGHVLRSRRPQILHADGGRSRAAVLALDRRLDLAALAVTRDTLEAMPIGDSRSLAPGHWVLALGHPHSPGGAVTAGTVIGVGPHLPEGADGRREWLALDLHLRPGYSGGPVIDGRGQLIGLNAMMTGPAVGIAVPIHTILPFLRQSIEQILTG